MRMCPECGAANKDSNKQCAECQHYIISSEVISDRDYFNTVLGRDKKRIMWKKIIAFSLVSIYFIFYNVWAANVCYGLFGNIYNYLKLIPEYLVCLAFFVFPYDKVYCFVRAKLNKPERHLSDFVICIFFAIGAIAMAFMYNRTYSVWIMYADIIKGRI